MQNVMRVKVRVWPLALKARAKTIFCWRVRLDLIISEPSTNFVVFPFFRHHHGANGLKKKDVCKFDFLYNFKKTFLLTDSRRLANWRRLSAVLESTLLDVVAADVGLDVSSLLSVFLSGSTFSTFSFQSGGGVPTLSPSLSYGVGS